MQKRLGTNSIEIQGVNIELPSPPTDKRKIAGWDKPTARQKWERTPLPESFKKLPRENPTGSLTPEQWAFIDQEFERRENGYWFYNNGEEVWLTGLHYFYLNWWKIDIGYPIYRNVDREYFYFWMECERDPRCYGMIEATRRRQGKSYRAGCVLYEYISRTAHANGGMQSKTDKDVLQLFGRAVVNPWRALPFFFKPNFDNTSNPKKELRFYAPARRGKKITSEMDEDELESQIDCRPCNEESYDGYKLHRYIDDECGKPTDANVDERWDIVKKCLQVDGVIIGKSVHTTTVEDMEDNKRHFEKMWKNSKYSERNQNGQTISGLYKFFQPAYKGYKLDEYGNDLIEESKREQLNTFEGLRHDPRKLASEKRKMPWTEDDMFRVDGAKCHFDSLKLQDRLDQLNAMTKLPFIKGNFEWINNERNGKVEFLPCMHGVPECPVCKFEVAHLPDLALQNNIDYTGYAGVYAYTPKNQLKYSAGCDPFQNKIVMDEKTASKAALYIRRKFDPLVDTTEKPPHQHETDMPVVRYSYRPRDIYEFYDDVIKVCWFYGCELFPENNKPNLKYWLQENGYQNFLIIKPEGVTRESEALRAKQDGGASSSPPMISHYTDLIEYDVNINCHKYPFPGLITDLLKFDNSDTQKFDDSVAWGYTLVGCQKKVIRRDDSTEVHYVRMYDQYGNRMN